jgi:anaerobic ribonucleoside-triphosphate reductase
MSQTITDYLHQNDWQVKENANMQYSLQGLRNHIVNDQVKEYWLNEYPDDIAQAHAEGDLHIHDLGELAAYCCGWDLQDLIRIGFTGVPGKVSCRPAKHFDAILGQIVNFVYTLQGEVAGAQAFSNFDTLLAPFIHYDNLSYDEVKQIMQSFVYNMNIPTRVGFQTPFFNLTMDMNAPDYLASSPVMIGGRLIDKTYGEFQDEMDLMNQVFAEVMLEGDGQGRVFTFPIPTYNITKDFHWDDERYRGIWEMSAKYGIPYFANYVNSDMDPSDARSMCCRLRLDNRELRSRGGGLFGSNPLTGSIGVVTLNLPRIGFLSRTKEDIFDRIDSLMNIARDSLEIKRDIIENLTTHGLYPYSRFYLEGIKQKSGGYWSNHFSTIGIVGMNELLLNFCNYDITSDVGRELASEILNYMRERMSEFQEETGNLYNLEATPAEGTSYRLARIDHQKYPGIVFANQEAVWSTNAQPYYTNSSQLPVGHTEDIFEALNLQDNLQAKYTGGTVLHGFLGERVHDLDALKNLVKAITSHYTLPYLTITPTFSICPEHGYVTGEHPVCEECGNICEVYSRVVGYIRPVDQWNDGKKQEYYDRKEFSVEQSVSTPALTEKQIQSARQ